MADAQRERRKRDGYIRVEGVLDAKLNSGLTYEQVADRCGEGYSLTSIRDWATKKSAPIHKLGKLAEVLGVSEKDLIGGD
jgi:transcriptional regulator with XRE-family HTH domain